MKKFVSILLCCVMVFACCPPVCGASEEAVRAADVLYALGLFSGTGVDGNGKPVYSLDQPLSRQEAITIVVNLLGAAHEAKATGYTVPFTDVDPWAVPFVGYAYANGVTAGFSETSYHARDTVTATQYLTFLLSCLGYQSKTDFSWNDAAALTDRIGITRGDYAGGHTLSRGDAVILSERALHAKMKGSDRTLSGHYLALALDPPLSLPADVAESRYAFRLSDVPAYSGKPYAVLNEGVPYFSAAELSHLSFEIYSPLDAKGRCRTAFACLAKDLMPTSPRGSIGQIKPSGWQTIRYDDLITDKYLYNRCHLIGFQLSGEDANEKNLITGTRYMNIEGMEPFETKVANYLRRNPDNHVLYRAEPVFEGSNLVATGVHLEALSEEDGGKGIKFNIFVYNVQPGVAIDYRTGLSERAGGQTVPVTAPEEEGPSGGSSPGVTREGINAANYRYIVNINPNSKRIHLPSCSSVHQMNESNKWFTDWTLQQLLDAGYVRCGRCNP